MLDRIITYQEMCQAEKVQTLQRGMNFRLNPRYSVILMSTRNNAPYEDHLHEDGVTIEYEGHDVPGDSAKKLDQQKNTYTGTMTQNGRFIKSIKEYKKGFSDCEKVKIYEKIQPGIWSDKGFFDLIDYNQLRVGNRKVFRFILRLSTGESFHNKNDYKIEHTRVIPTSVKQVVYKRDKGQCVLCGSNKNLHYDHDLPFSKGGTSLDSKNIRLLCRKCNLMKSDKIE